MLEQREGPWRDYYYEDSTFLEESERVPGGFREADGQRFETLSVLQARLRHWTPPPFAHVV